MTKMGAHALKLIRVQALMGVAGWVAASAPSARQRPRRCAPGAPLFLQKDIEEGVVDANLAVVFDEAELAEAIHEKAHPGAGGADHLSQQFLADLGDHGFGFALLAELGEQ